MKPIAPKETELVAIMQRLAPDYDRSEVERFAHSLAAAAVVAKAGEGAAHGRKGKTRALVETRQLNERAIALLRHLDELDGISAFLLDKELAGDGHSLRQAMESLCALANASVGAHGDIGAQPGSSSRTGRPGKSAGKAIARDAARYFELLTGKAPTRAVKGGRLCGPFARFLGEIFEALEIDASVEDCARAAVMEKSRASSE